MASKPKASLQQVNEHLVLLEFFVERVVFNKAQVIKNGKIVVDFQFMENDPICIESTLVRKDMEASELCTKESINLGKTCLFSLTPEEVAKVSALFDIYIRVYIDAKCGTSPKTPVGIGLIPVTDQINRIIKRAGDKNSDSSPGASEYIRNSFPLYGLDNPNVVGHICISVRLSCYGKYIQTDFQMNMDRKSIDYKANDAQYRVQYNKKFEACPEKCLDPKEPPCEDPTVCGTFPESPAQASPCPPSPQVPSTLTNTAASQMCSKCCTNCTSIATTTTESHKPCPGKCGYVLGSAATSKATTTKSGKGKKGGKGGKKAKKGGKGKGKGGKGKGKGGKGKGKGGKGKQAGKSANSSCPDVCRYSPNYKPPPPACGHLPLAIPTVCPTCCTPQTPQPPPAPQPMQPNPPPQPTCICKTEAPVTMMYASEPNYKPNPPSNNFQINMGQAGSLCCRVHEEKPPSKIPCPVNYMSPPTATGKCPFACSQNETQSQNNQHSPPCMRPKQPMVVEMGPGPTKDCPFRFKIGDGAMDQNQLCVSPPTYTAKDGTNYTEISDPNKQVFLMRIGKKFDGVLGGRNNVDLHLTTPPPPIPDPIQDERGQQYKIGDAPPGSTYQLGPKTEAKDKKGKKGKKDKKGKKKPAKPKKGGKKKK